MLLRRIGLWIPLLACVSLPALAQQLPASDSTANSAEPKTPVQPDSGGPIFTLHATARLVVLDVTVNDNQGHPLKNLKPSDFTLTEDGVEQHLLSVTEHDASDFTPPAPEPVLPPNTFATHTPVSAEIPKVVIVLGNLAFTDAPFVRDELRAFSRTLAAGTPVAIFSIDWKGLHLIQSLTADHAALEEAASSQRILPPVGFPVRYLRRNGSPTQQLARYLATIPGRINLVWFGAAIPAGHDENLFPSLSSGVPPDLAAFVAHENAAPSVLRLSRIALYPIVASGLIGDFGPPPDLLASANSADNLDFGLSGTAMDSYAAGLDMSSCQNIMEMANSSGGKGYCNTNGFKEALADVVLTGSHYYTISYTPTNANWNGAYRHIKVDIAPAQPVTTLDKFLAWLEPLNGQVLYRDGYFARTRPERPTPNLTAQNSTPATASTPDDQQSKLTSYSAKGDTNIRGNPGGPAANINAAMAFGMPLPNQLPVKITVTPYLAVEKFHPETQSSKETFLAVAMRTQPFRNYKIHYFIALKDLQFTKTSRGYTDTFDFVAVVYRDDGFPANSIDHTAHIDVNPSQYGQIMAKGLSYDQTIAIPITDLKDNFFLRTGVHELPTNRIGVVELPTEWIRLPSPQTITAAAKPTP